MQIAIALYPHVTALDAIGPYEVLSRLPDAETVLVAQRPGPVRADGGRELLIADAAFEDARSPDVVVVPGGTGHGAQLADGPLQRWLREAAATSRWTTSVCVGSLILGAAGLLDGRRATSHWLALDRLPAYGAEPTLERVVFDGTVVTAAGVSSGVDMALALAGRIAGDDLAQALQLGIEYDPRPPYRAGSPETAPEPIVATLRSAASFVLDGVPAAAP